MVDDFNRYYEASEPDKRERAFDWATAIGLQDVDGLKPSNYLLEMAKRNIEGEISADEARRLVDEYYETKEGHDAPDDEREADKVSARINQLIRSPSFRLAPEFYISLHGFIFDGVFPHAGSLRKINITKREWVLNGDTVRYELESMIGTTLAYDFAQESKFKYVGLNENRFVEHFSTFISNIWQVHPFREGNTRTTALFAIKYLRSKGFLVENDLFAQKSFYFRNALVRANYENQRLGVERTTLYLEEFFKVLLYGYDIALHNRFMKIGQEHGSAAADAIQSMHRSDVRRDNVRNGIKTDHDGIKHDDDGIKARHDGINDGIKHDEQCILKAVEEKAVMAILKDSRITGESLANVLGIKKRQAERIISALKKKAGLRRVGSRKTGSWTFAPEDGK